MRRIPVEIPIDHCMLQGMPGAPYWQHLGSRCVGNGTCKRSADAECQLVGDVYLCPCQPSPEGCGISELLPGLGAPGYADREAASAKLLSCCTHDVYVAELRARASTVSDAEVRERLERGAEICSKALHPCGSSLLGGIIEEEGRCLYSVSLSPDAASASTNDATCVYDRDLGFWLLHVPVSCTATNVQFSRFVPQSSDAVETPVLSPSNCPATVTVPQNMLPRGNARYVISGLIPEKVDGVSTAPELCNDAELRAEMAAQQIAGGVPANACSEEPIIYTDWDRQPKARAITCGGGRPGYYWVDDDAPLPPGGADGGQDGGTAPPPGGGTGGQDDGGPLPPPITEMP